MHTGQVDGHVRLAGAESGLAMEVPFDPHLRIAIQLTQRHKRPDDLPQRVGGVEFQTMRGQIGGPALLPVDEHDDIFHSKACVLQRLAASSLLPPLLMRSSTSTARSPG